MYCRNWKEDFGFKQVVHSNSGTRRGMCPGCQEMRKKPHSELIALAERDKTERTKK